MSGKRVLFLNHVGQVAGAERSLETLIEALDRRRYAPYAICPEGPLTDRLARAGAQVRHFPLQRFHRTRNPFRLFGHAAQAFRTSRRIAREWRNSPVDLVHSNSTTAHIYGVMLARRWDVPCVWHARDLVPLGAMGRWLYAHSDAVIAISRAVAECVRRAARDDRKIHVIPNGFNVDAPAPSASPAEVRSGLGVSPTAPVVAVVAQFVPWKRHDVFLRAFASVVRNQPDAVALIVGDDLFGDNPRYKTAILDLAKELRLEDNVRFLGWREDAPSLLNACDLLVIPSQAEPFGRVALEAMAAGKPVVGTRAGGLTDIVAEGETGLLVPPADADALAAAILRLFVNPDLARQMGAAGRERLRRFFDIRLIARRVQSLYDTLLSKSPGRD